MLDPAEAEVEASDFVLKKEEMAAGSTNCVTLRLKPCNVLTYSSVRLQVEATDDDGADKRQMPVKKERNKYFTEPERNSRQGKETVSQWQQKWMHGTRTSGINSRSID